MERYVQMPLPSLRRPFGILAAALTLYVIASPRLAVAFTVSGKIRYLDSGLPVAGVIVEATGPRLVSAITDIEGRYTLTGLEAGGWQVRPRKDGAEHATISSFDASLALRHGAEIEPLSPQLLVACDVNMDTAVDATDGRRILDFKVGLRSRMPADGECSSDWVFFPTSSGPGALLSPAAVGGVCVGGAISYAPLAGDAAEQDFAAAGYGDCSGNWMNNDIQRLFGLGFSPYGDGQSPNLGTQIPIEQLRQLAVIARPFIGWMRTFGATDGLESAGQVARELGLSMAMGIWLSGDSEANDAQVANAVAAAQAGEVDMLIVGSETLLRGNLTPQQLIAYINAVRAAAPAGVLLTTADVYTEFLQHPEVIDAVDVVLANIYPYWEEVPIGDAVCVVDQRYRRLVQAAGAKPVWISESGWPSCGNTLGGAVPSGANAATYFRDFVSWAEGVGVNFFYFSFRDEAWKAAIEGPQGACWGLWTTQSVLKPGMAEVLTGQRSSPAVWGAEVIGGAGLPSIAFTSVPALGSFADLYGAVEHVAPRDYTVAVYIRVAGNWWTKPMATAPLTPIGCSGNWVADITTGGIDEQATEIRAYLLPSGVGAPVVLGAAALPPELDTLAVASMAAQRS